MSELRTISPLSRALALAGVFGLGVLSHWSYSQFQAPGPEVDIFYETQRERSARLRQSALPTADDVIKAQDHAGSAAGVEVWRAENARQKQLAEKFSGHRATQVSDRAAALASRQLALLGGTVRPPAPLHMPQELVSAGALARAERTIMSVAAIAHPQGIDGDRIMVSALRSQLQTTRQARLALRQRLSDKQRLEENLRRARLRIERLAEREIIRAASVRLPVAPTASFMVKAGPAVAQHAPVSRPATAARILAGRLPAARKLAAETLAAKPISGRS